MSEEGGNGRKKQAEGSEKVSYAGKSSLIPLEMDRSKFGSDRHFTTVKVHWYCITLPTLARKLYFKDAVFG